jgi:hypothetical protein
VLVLTVAARVVLVIVVFVVLVVLVLAVVVFVLVLALVVDPLVVVGVVACEHVNVIWVNCIIALPSVSLNSNVVPSAKLKDVVCCENGAAEAISTPFLYMFTFPAFMQFPNTTDALPEPSRVALRVPISVPLLHPNHPFEQYGPTSVEDIS